MTLGLAACGSSSIDDRYCERWVAASDAALDVMRECPSMRWRRIAVEECKAASLNEACDNPADKEAIVNMLYCYVSAGECTPDTEEAWYSAAKACYNDPGVKPSDACLMIMEI